MAAKSISHSETMEAICWYLQGNHQKPGFLRWCRILSIHSMNGYGVGGMAVVVKTVLGSHFGVGMGPPILVHFSGDWDVHSGYGIHQLTWLG